MNSFIYDLFERIGSESSRLVRIEKRKTLYASDIQSAIKLILPGQLGKHGVSEAVKCLPHGRPKGKEHGACCDYVSREVKNCRMGWR